MAYSNLDRIPTQQSRMDRSSRDVATSTVRRIVSLSLLLLLQHTGAGVDAFVSYSRVPNDSAARATESVFKQDNYSRTLSGKGWKANKRMKRRGKGMGKGTGKGTRVWQRHKTGRQPRKHSRMISSNWMDHSRRNGHDVNHFKSNYLYYGGHVPNQDGLWEENYVDEANVVENGSTPNGGENEPDGTFEGADAALPVNEPPVSPPFWIVPEDNELDQDYNIQAGALAPAAMPISFLESEGYDASTPTASNWQEDYGYAETPTWDYDYQEAPSRTIFTASVIWGDETPHTSPVHQEKGGPLSASVAWASHPSEAQVDPLPDAFLPSPSPPTAPTSRTPESPRNGEMPNYKQTVKSKPLVVEIHGSFDDFIGAEEITTVIEQEMQSYFHEMFGAVLNTFRLDISNANDDFANLGSRRSLEKTDAILRTQIVTIVEFEGSLEDLTTITEDVVTSYVVGFFEGVSLERLTQTLLDNGIDVDTIHVIQEDVISTTKASSSDQDSGGSSSSSSHKSHAGIIAAVSGSCVGILLVAAIIQNRQAHPRRTKLLIGEQESHKLAPHSDDDDDNDNTAGDTPFTPTSSQNSVNSSLLKIKSTITKSTQSTDETTVMLFPDLLPPSETFASPLYMTPPNVNVLEKEQWLQTSVSAEYGELGIHQASDNNLDIPKLDHSSSIQWDDVVDNMNGSTHNSSSSHDDDDDNDSTMEVNALDDSNQQDTQSSKTPTPLVVQNDKKGQSQPPSIPKMMDLQDSLDVPNMDASDKSSVRSSSNNTTATTTEHPQSVQSSNSVDVCFSEIRMEHGPDLIAVAQMVGLSMFEKKKKKQQQTKQRHDDDDHDDTIRSRPSLNNKLYSNQHPWDNRDSEDDNDDDYQDALL